MLKAAIILALMCLASTSQSTSAKIDVSECYGPETPKKIADVMNIQSMSCDSDSDGAGGAPDILVYGELHSSSSDKSFASSLDSFFLKDREQIHLYEGMRYNPIKGQLSNGLDTGKISEITALRIYSQLFQLGVMAREFEKAQQLQIKSVSVILNLSSEFKSIKRPMKDPLAERYALALESLIGSSGAISNRDQLPNSDGMYMIREFVAFVSAFLPEIEKSLNSDPDFKHLSKAEVDQYGIQHLRELKWLKVINKNLCEARSLKKALIVQVGANHSDTLACAIKKISPASVVMKTGGKDLPVIVSALREPLLEFLPMVKSLIERNVSKSQAEFLRISIERPTNAQLDLPPFILNIEGLDSDLLDQEEWYRNVLLPLNKELENQGYRLQLEQSRFLKVVAPIYPITPVEMIRERLPKSAFVK